MDSIIGDSKVSEKGKKVIKALNQSRKICVVLKKTNGSPPARSGLNSPVSVTLGGN